MGSEGFHCSVDEINPPSHLFVRLPPVKTPHWEARKLTVFCQNIYNQSLQSLTLQHRSSMKYIKGFGWTWGNHKPFSTQHPGHSVSTPACFQGVGETQIWFLELRVIKADARWWLEPNVSSSRAAAAPWCMKTLCITGQTAWLVSPWWTKTLVPSCWDTCYALRNLKLKYVSPRTSGFPNVLKAS